MKATIKRANFEFTFVDEDVVNPEEYIPKGESNPHDVHGFLLHDHGFTLCVVFASNLQDALDEAADAGELPYDIENVDIVEFPNPPFSLVALLNAEKR